jgi:hypothetical protein
VRSEERKEQARPAATTKHKNFKHEVYRNGKKRRVKAGQLVLLKFSKLFLYRTFFLSVSGCFGHFCLLFGKIYYDPAVP